MRLLLTICFFSSCALCVGQDNTPQESPIKTTLCEIKAHPEKFNHKLVEFRATASHGFEDSMVESKECPWPENGNPGVWMEYGGTLTTRTMSTVSSPSDAMRPQNVTVDGLDIPLVADETFKKFDDALHTSPEPKISRTIEATLQGRIFARQERLANTQAGPLRWEGYGHLGCCMLFVVIRVVDVGTPGTRPD